jgi:hypothetical protein
MNRNLSLLTRGALIALGFMLALAVPAKAGEPDKTIGGIDENRYVCADAQHRVVDLDSDAFNSSDGDVLSFDETKTVDLNQLDEDCKDAEDEDDENYTIELVQQARLEGYVVEYHPDPGAPGGWRGVYSRDVPVVMFGPGFEVFKASDKDGSFYFDNLGAGPVTFNLRLPPDAHALNPNVTIVTDGFATVTSGIYLAFYRGDMPPPTLETLQAPDGGPLPPANFIFEDVEGSGTFALYELTGMPNVGGVPEKQPSLYTIGLALALLILLPVAGLLKLRRSRFDN